MHFADMKRDHEGSVRKIAKFLGIEPRADQWPTILECTSFPWMKAHERRFEIPTAAEIPILMPGAMVRKGKTGTAREDGVTPAISAEIADVGRRMLANEEAFGWAYRGGELPRPKPITRRAASRRPAAERSAPRASARKSADRKGRLAKKKKPAAKQRAESTRRVVSNERGTTNARPAAKLRLAARRRPENR
jgi:hypothetical protein